MSDKEVVYLTRDCYALMVPSGAKIMLHEGSEVVITQSLGHSYTVNVYGNLARIDGRDADALGKENVAVTSTLPSDASIMDHIWAQLRTVYDPEIPVNIVELGLVYDCQIQPHEQEENQYHVKITMTLTAPGCGMGPVIAEDVKQRVMDIPQVLNAEVEIVFDPPWSQEKMSDVAKLELGMF